MNKTNLDMDALRTFVIGQELGTYRQAAEKLNRSTSAISSQIKKLEQQVGAPLFYKEGRLLKLTAVGGILFEDAKHLLTLNDHFFSKLDQQQTTEHLKIGLTEDFSHSFLPVILKKLADLYPQVHVEAHIMRNDDLLTRLQQKQLDFVIGWAQEDYIATQVIADLPICWVSASSYFVTTPVKLVSYHNSCLFHNLATHALNEAKTTWYLSFTSSNLVGLWAGLSSHLGITARTPLFLPSYLKILPPCQQLPVLPNIQLCLYQQKASVIADLFAKTIIGEVQQHLQI
ncbi:LysR family transcriptional regulator [Acinetobacter sp. HY1485]|uniref:LysR family transcriptional regulator n=1 Tax=Acinetobacter sp. HY1485 TaxID=2970918 RepID=UPI0022B9A7EB|nr:LysR family transcriptional regulator [Acinetobacter sp. HY1485]